MSKKMWLSDEGGVVLVDVIKHATCGNGFARTQNGGIVHLYSDPAGLLTEDERLWAEDVYGYIDDAIVEKILQSRELQLPRQPRLNLERDSKHAQAVQEARALARKAGWPELTGTTKQKWWAVQLRQEMVIKLPISMQDFVVLNHRSSAWWIEHRNTSMAELLKLIAAEQVENQHHQERQRQRLRQIEEQERIEQLAQQAADERKRQEMDLATLEFLPVLESHLHLLSPLPTQQAIHGIKLCDGVTRFGRLRVFEALDTEERLYLLNGEAGRQAFTLAAVKEETS